MARPLAARGHGRAGTADIPDRRQVPGPANLVTCSPLPAPGPVVVLVASPPALARVLPPAVRLQLPGISQRRGYWKAPHRCSAELPSLPPLLSGAEEAPG